MKHILTLLALVFATSCFGQEACPNVHDINSNGTIDIEDFLSILGLFADVDVDEDGVWDSQDDCLDATACNYLASPTEPCGYLDALGECGGACEGDGDGDGICDDVDTCVGELDECGVCNGPGPTEVVIEDIIITYDSIYLPVDDEWFVYAIEADTTFSYTCGPVSGCTEDEACNYNISAVLDDGTCEYPAEGFDCNGLCLGESNAVSIGITTDAWGYEMYWELIPSTGTCGDGSAVSWGGNPDVGCGDGIPGLSGNIYGNFVEVTTEPVCVPWDTELTLVHVDDYGDGGSEFDVFINGCLNQSLIGTGSGNNWSIEPPGEYLGCTNSLACNYSTCATQDDGTCDYQYCFHQCGSPYMYQGYDYETVLIGEQCWFAENLRSESYENGDLIQSGLTNSGWENASEGAFAVYGISEGCEDQSPTINACNPVQALEEYGLLYNGWAVHDPRHICPTGWHVSSSLDWSILAELLGGTYVAAAHLKTVDGWYNNGGGTNSSGFSALPGGYRSNGGASMSAGDIGRWWTTNQALEGETVTLYSGDYGLVSFSTDMQNTGHSVRCIRDSE